MSPSIEIESDIRDPRESREQAWRYIEASAGEGGSAKTFPRCHHTLAVK